MARISSNQLRLAPALMLIWVFGGVGGCKSNNDPETVVRKYFSVERCTDRAALALAPDKVRPHMEVHYRDTATCKAELKSLDVGACKDLQPGQSCRASATSAKDENFSVCLDRTTDGLKIDWPCTVGFNETSVAAFKASSTGSLAVIRAQVRLNDRQEGTYAYSFSITDKAGGQINGFARRESSVGRQMFDLVKDGKWHPATVELWRTPKAEGIVARLVQSDWRMRPEEIGEAPTSTSFGGITGPQQDCKALAACCSHLPESSVREGYCTYLLYGVADEKDCTSALPKARSRAKDDFSPGKPLVLDGCMDPADVAHLASPAPASASSATDAPDLSHLKGTAEERAALAACCKKPLPGVMVEAACLAISVPDKGIPDCADALRRVRAMYAEDKKPLPAGCAASR